MIEDLQKKIFWSIELAAMALLMIILIAFNLLNYWQNGQEEWQMMRAAARFESLEQGRGMQTDDAAEEEGSSLEDDEYWISGQGQGAGKRRGERKREKLLRSLMNGRMGLIHLNEAGDILEAEGMAEEYEEEEIEEMTLAILKMNKDRGRYQGLKFLVEESGDGDRTLVFLDTAFLSYDTVQLLGLSLAALLGAALLFALLARTLARRIARPVDETMRMQKQFIADASHELKTPVTVINANIAILEKELGQNRWLSFIKEEGSRMSELVNSLLRISRLDYEIENEKSRLPKENYDLANVVMGVGLSFESVAFERKVSIDLASIPDSLMLKGYPEDMKQLTGILLDNAIKHAPAGGQVGLSLISRDRNVLLQVSNTGEKIPDDVLPHIFNRFYKQDSSRQYEANSFGLGLAMAKALAEKNGGRISVSSDSEKTVFRVTL